MALLLALIPAQLSAQTAASSGFENLDKLEQRVSKFAGEGRHPRMDRRLRLSPCDVAPELLWYGTSETTVLVRCGGSKSWQIYVPVVVDHQAPGVASTQNGTVVVARPVPRGNVLTAGDLTIKPATTISGGVGKIEDAVGKVAVRALNAGEAVRMTMVAAPPQVKRGDPVQIRNGVSGLEISVAGVAEEDGPQGGRVRVRNAATGERMQAIVTAPGIVALPGYKNPESGRE